MGSWLRMRSERVIYSIPPLYLITPALRVISDLPFEAACEQFLIKLELVLKKGIRLLQLRQKELSPSEYQALAEQVIPLAKRYGAHILLNQHIDLAIRLQASGVHLPVSDWIKHDVSPVPTPFWLALSCHSLAELKTAQKLNPDFVVLSPITPSASHPKAPPLGWEKFAERVKQVKMPVFALGGLTPDHLKKVRRLGGHGVAAIRGLWFF